MFSVYSVSTYRCDETGLIRLRISSDTLFINNIKIYRFYPGYKTTSSYLYLPAISDYLYTLKFENFKVEYFHCNLQIRYDFSSVSLKPQQNCTIYISIKSTIINI